MPGMGGGLAAAAGRPSATGGGGRTTLLTMSFRDLEQTSPTDNSAARRNGTAGPAPITDKNANNVPLVSYAQMNGAQPHDLHIYGIYYCPTYAYCSVALHLHTFSSVFGANLHTYRIYTHIYIYIYIYIRLT